MCILRHLNIVHKLDFWSVSNVLFEGLISPSVEMGRRKSNLNAIFCWLYHTQFWGSRPQLISEQFFISSSHISAPPARLHIFRAGPEFCFCILNVFLSQTILFQRFQSKCLSENILFHLFLPCKIQRNKWNKEM